MQPGQLNAATDPPVPIAPVSLHEPDQHMIATVIALR
jgi:hypothetical protein